ncbi:XrtB/PEP-CTERM-associated transcriptional regulator EpsA [Nitrosovibrio sp. Nv6]|uniref:XrtB/PEP-CTERM-associated transcriptional regulator EpsA n=1 Tax=Nitrosovibrio sp. Nv6 TaxID=1855340 RepID=UPI0008CC2424|nr:XrtB/PEP-CTERM-associated transcriptional regulator EpsA [Nitrosovibrio sp. Nv6]SEP35412.1 transcriptional regulator EpsA [Nitrosovibrio sp. Nv6]
MGLFSSLSADHLQRYFRIIQEGLAVRQHFDLLMWLQGEVQQYLPHEIMLVGWGDFSSNSIQHDIISPLPGVRTARSESAVLSPLLRTLYNRWIELGRMPCASNVGATDTAGSRIAQAGSPKCSFGIALQGMHSSLLHGISDKRGRHDCLYVIFSSQDKLNDSTLGAMEILLPYLDTAMRRVAPLPQSSCQPSFLANPRESENHGLSEREIEIMEWVRKGKTNAEIGSILCISSYTVKNHLHQIFRKLDVYNRVQAVSKVERRARHG